MELPLVYLFRSRDSYMKRLKREEERQQQRERREEQLALSRADSSSLTSQWNGLKRSQLISGAAADSDTDTETDRLLERQRLAQQQDLENSNQSVNRVKKKKEGKVPFSEFYGVGIGVCPILTNALVFSRTAVFFPPLRISAFRIFSLVSPRNVVEY